ncbi:hypothetical protein RTCCBAU85039_6910 [Rhizobium tibeticum]|uniref:Uncharacterized protein n=1 Tax=Rhizobium tibeticum TaxID=501024 RepID=A0A1K0JQ63_9HYPH|nr:hypothetical protein RTCCBAU85039_6910 [Rhizobium tibeticum]
MTLGSDPHIRLQIASSERGYNSILRPQMNDGSRTKVPGTKPPQTQGWLIQVLAVYWSTASSVTGPASESRISSILLTAAPRSSRLHSELPG